MLLQPCDSLLLIRLSLVNSIDVVIVCKQQSLWLFLAHTNGMNISKLMISIPVS